MCVGGGEGGGGGDAEVRVSVCGEECSILTVLGLTTHAHHTHTHTYTHTHTRTHKHTYTHTHTHAHTQLTKLLHKPLVSYMREKFISRLVTIKPDWSFADELTDKQIKQLEGEVYAAASTMNIVFLDCDVNFPGDFDNTNLHPHFVYRIALNFRGT